MGRVDNKKRNPRRDRGVTTYGIFKGNDLEIAELIQQRRLQLLVHSCIYYELDSNIISDKTWDEWARELKTLQKKYPKIAKRVIWHEAFEDWDATTGAFLPLQDNWVRQKANHLLNIQTIPQEKVVKEVKPKLKKRIKTPSKKVVKKALF